MPLHENLPHTFFTGTKGSNKFTVDATLVTTKAVTLSNIPHSNAHLFVIYNGTLLDEGPGNDYILSGAIITFLPDFELVVSDKILALYHY